MEDSDIEMVALFDRVNHVSTPIEILRNIPSRPYLIVYSLVVVVSVFLFIYIILTDSGESFFDAMIYLPFYTLTFFKIVDIGYMYKVIDLLDCLTTKESFSALCMTLAECVVIILTPLAMLFQLNKHLQSHYEMFVNAATFVVLWHDQYVIFAVALLFSQFGARCTPFKKRAVVSNGNIIVVDLESRQLAVNELSALYNFSNKIKSYVFTRFKLFSVCFLSSSAVVVYLGRSNLNNYALINFALCSMMFLSTSWLITRVNDSISKVEGMYEVDLNSIKLRVLNSDTSHILSYSISCTVIVTVFHLLFGSTL